MDLALSEKNAVIATGTASGKSLAYLAPVLSALLDGMEAPNGRGATALYLAPTKALAADQLRRVKELDTGVRAAVYDGDTPFEEREWVRQYAAYVLTNPDMLHRGILPAHPRWATLLRTLRYVVVDECHTYRGVFGSHVAQVLRRLRRLCARYGADPVFLLASATVAEPAASAGRLTGLPVAEVTEDHSPHGEMVFALWEPPLTEMVGEQGAPVRRSAVAETAELLGELAGGGTRTVAFVRSRRGAELVSILAQDRLSDRGGPAGRIAAYRGGYLADERRALERALQSGRLLGLASNSALELGIDVSGLDAVLLAGYPGTRASLWQQAGRAGRAGQGALAVLVARDDPLDTYLVHHPDALLRRPVEATVLDPGNPYVQAPHLCAAAAELPLSGADLAGFGDGATAVAEALVAEGMLRRRGDRLYWTRRGPAGGLRGTSGQVIRIVEEATGRLVGTVDEPSAQLLVHTGAVYLHQAETYLVTGLDLAGRVALVVPGDPGYATSAREVTAIEVTAGLGHAELGGAAVHFGDVDVVRQVVSFTRRDPETGRSLGEVPLELPPRALRTRAVWWTLAAPERAALAARGVDLPGAAHAAEHTAIGLLPLFAACDRWDIGGVSADMHPATGMLTVFVYDGHEGGAGFAERGFAVARDWLAATAEAIASCECQAGCPSCIQSPKCGSGNEPLSKDGALRLLRTALGGRADDTTPAEETPRETGRETGRPPPGGRAGVAARPVPQRGTAGIQLKPDDDTGTLSPSYQLVTHRRHQ
jgi:DEAD/DEAH box helicase domain-containing protein